jgi:hypothetical protein
LLLEFKEIRKEWKARKKEEDAQRKADDERHRSSMGGPPVDGNGTDGSAQTPTSQNYPGGVRQLPPIAYSQAPGGEVAAQYPPGSQGMYPGNGQGYSTYPHSPYNQGGPMYQQRE